MLRGLIDTIRGLALTHYSYYCNYNVAPINTYTKKNPLIDKRCFLLLLSNGLT